MFKDTSLASVVAMPELLKEANNAQALYANPSPLIGAALVYLDLPLADGPPGQPCSKRRFKSRKDDR